MILNLFHSIAKPILLLDAWKARQNIHQMAEKARQSKVTFRPHFKTHQSIEIGSWFRDEGVQKITVSSVDMAEYFASAGWNDITIAFPLNIRQLPQIQELASRINLGVLVESVDAIHSLGNLRPAKLTIWIKVDCGYHRTGISWDHPELVSAILAETGRYPNLSVAGLLTHAGNTYTSQTVDEAIRIHIETNQRMFFVRDAVGRSNLQISVGDTPGCSLLPGIQDVDEIRPGNFVFYDAEQMEIGSCSPEQISVSLACPIVAVHPERDEVVIYGGSVHLSKQSFIHEGKPSYGLVALPSETGWGELLPDCSISRLSQEHGVLSVPQSMQSSFKPGDLVVVIPTHSCLTAHLMRRYLTLDGHTIEMMPI